MKDALFLEMIITYLQRRITKFACDMHAPSIHFGSTPQQNDIMICLEQTKDKQCGVGGGEMGEART